MPKMFGFSRRRMKLGRLKGHLHDPFHGSRSPSRQTKRFRHPNGEDPVTTSVSGHADDLAWRCSSDTFDLNGRAYESSENWAVLSKVQNLLKHGPILMAAVRDMCFNTNSASMVPWDNSLQKNQVLKKHCCNRLLDNEADDSKDQHTLY